jgi:hypothetical protein
MEYPVGVAELDDIRQHAIVKCPYCGTNHIYSTDCLGTLVECYEYPGSDIPLPTTYPWLLLVEVEEEKADGFIYFIRRRSGVRIKIGFSIDPANRVKELQVGSDDNLEVLAILPASRADEGKMHEQFRDLRKIGEWFEPSFDLFIEILKARKSHKQPLYVVDRFEVRGIL